MVGLMVAQVDVVFDTAPAWVPPALTAARVSVYVGLSLLAGGLATAGWLLRSGMPVPAGGAGTAAPESLVDDPSTGSAVGMERAASRLAAGGGLLVAIAAMVVLILGLSNALGRRPGELLDAALLGSFAGTPFGTGMLLLSGAGLAAAVITAVVRTNTGRWIACGAAVVGVLGLATGGHANVAKVEWLAVLAAASHAGAAALWVGGLAVLALVVLRSDVAPPVAFIASARFSRLAGWALGVVVASGVATVALHAESIDQVLDTRWGRLSLVKSALLIGVVALGALSRRRLVPGLQRGARDGTGTFRRVALLELAIMVAAFGVAGTMTTGEPPQVEAAGRVVTASADFGDDATVEVTADPNRDEFHIYVFAQGTSALRIVEGLEADVVDGSGDPVDVQLFPAGPGHLDGVGFTLPEDGEVVVTVRGTVDGELREATVRLRPRG